MTKKEYERVRVEIAKKYKDEIQEVKLENIRLKEMIVEERKEKEDLKKKLRVLQDKIDRLPNSDSLFGLFSRYSDIFNNL